MTLVNQEKNLYEKEIERLSSIISSSGLPNVEETPDLVDIPEKNMEQLHKQKSVTFRVIKND